MPACIISRPEEGEQRVDLIRACTVRYVAACTQICRDAKSYQDAIRPQILNAGCVLYASLVVTDERCRNDYIFAVHFQPAGRLLVLHGMAPAAEYSQRYARRGQKTHVRYAILFKAAHEQDEPQRVSSALTA